MPRIAPMIEKVFLDCGIGDSIATGWPRLVIVTGSWSLFICVITRRHLALNSVAVIVFNIAALLMNVYINYVYYTHVMLIDLRFARLDPQDVSG